MMISNLEEFQRLSSKKKCSVHADRREGNLTQEISSSLKRRHSRDSGPGQNPEFSDQREEE